MQQPAKLDGHLVRVGHQGRDRFGVIVQSEVFGKLHQFLFEVEKGEMPVASIEPESIICDYGNFVDGWGEYEWLKLWFYRVHALSVAIGVSSYITSLRAVLIVCGDLTIIDGDPELIAGVKNAQTQFGKDLDAWSDEALKMAVMLSMNEEARSVQEIENRAKLAKLIADQINSEQ